MLCRSCHLRLNDCFRCRRQTWIPRFCLAYGLLSAPVRPTRATSMRRWIQAYYCPRTKPHPRRRHSRAEAIPPRANLVLQPFVAPRRAVQTKRGTSRVKRAYDRMSLACSPTRARLRMTEFWRSVSARARLAFDHRRQLSTLVLTNMSCLTLGVTVVV